MLVLSRKSGQGIHLSVAGLDVELSVIRISGNRVQIGFAAPSSVNILRSELSSTVTKEMATQIGQPQSTIISAISNRYPK